MGLGSARFHGDVQGAKRELSREYRIINAVS